MQFSGEAQKILGKDLCERMQKKHLNIVEKFILNLNIKL